MFEGIAGSIVHGAAGALWTMLAAVPLPVWLILFFALIIFGVLVRYLTDIKVDLALAGIVFVLCLVIYYREHWIEMGYAEANAKVIAAQKSEEGYKATEKLIEKCYAKNFNATILWDHTSGQCVRVNGSPL